MKYVPRHGREKKDTKTKFMLPPILIIIMHIDWWYDRASMCRSWYWGFPRLRLGLVRTI